MIAKVTRDRMMTELHDVYPQYDFAQHKGYITPMHAAALIRYGPCPEHRLSYANVAAVVRRVGRGERTVPSMVRDNDGGGGHGMSDRARVSGSRCAR